MASEEPAPFANRWKKCWLSWRIYLDLVEMPEAPSNARCHLSVNHLFRLQSSIGQEGLYAAILEGCQHLVTNRQLSTSGPVLEVLFRLLSFGHCSIWFQA